VIRRIHLLPIVIFVGMFVFSVKAGTFWSDIDRVIGMISISESYAQTASDSPPERADASTSPADARTPPDTVTSSAAFDPLALSATELALLHDLSARRTELDMRERQIDLREKVLMAAEDRVQKKIDDLKNVEVTVLDLLRQYDEQENARMSSLVKIYQNMKPKDAARIFDELDFDVLVEVLERMRETSAAPILARMNPDRAKSLTLELAERGRLPETAGDGT
jgi:flagellar motility protein MotE (MotC chaperone)